MPSDLQPDPPEPLPIYVGETDGALRLWLAHEAMRQAEQVLAGQTASLTALETRATTLLTWSATSRGSSTVSPSTTEKVNWLPTTL